MGNRGVLWRRLALKPIHTWIGIIAGGLLAILGTTGSAIVFREELKHAALPGGASSSQNVSLDKAAREVTRIWPDAHVRRVRLPSTPGEPLLLQLGSEEEGTLHAVSDPASGRVLGTVDAGWVEWLIDLHRNLLSGKQGRKVVGIAGIILFVLSAAGLLMWLIGSRSWRSWITVRRTGSTRRFHFELHRASGLWAYCFLAVISFTGIERAFPDIFRQAMKSTTRNPSMRKPKKDRVKAKSTPTMDEYLRVGRAVMPDGRPVELRLPQGGKGMVDLRLYRAGDLSPDSNHVYMDPATGAVAMIDRVADRPFGERFLAALAPIHYGEFGGLPIKLLWSLLGLTPALLFVTGLFAWWRPKRKPSQPVHEEAEDLALVGR